MARCVAEGVDEGPGGGVAPASDSCTRGDCSGGASAPGAPLRRGRRGSSRSSGRTEGPEKAAVRTASKSCAGAARRRWGEGAHAGARVGGLTRTPRVDQPVGGGRRSGGSCERGGEARGEGGGGACTRGRVLRRAPRAWERGRPRRPRRRRSPSVTPQRRSAASQFRRELSSSTPASWRPGTWLGALLPAQRASASAAVRRVPACRPGARAWAGRTPSASNAMG